MARYEKADRFWEIALAGTTITITEGTIGSPGITTTEVLPSVAIANTRWKVLINQRGRAGFKLYRSPGEQPEPKPELPPEPVVHDASNPELEAAILDDPENETLYEVYGDWLQKQGDPRGKHIALALAMRNHDAVGPIVGSFRRFEIEHRDYLIGGRSEHGWTLSLGLGFVTSIEGLAGTLATGIAEALALPSTRFVTTIHLDREADDGDPDASGDLAAAVAVVAASAPPTLRRLTLGGDADLPDLDALVPRLPRLRELALANISDRTLAVGRRCLATLAKTPLPTLEWLTLELLAGDCQAADVARLLASELPALRGLTLRTLFDHANAEALCDLPIAGRLEHLTFDAPDLGHEAETEGIAGTLLRHRTRFPRLRRLGLPLEQLPKDQLAELGTTGWTLDNADGQERYINSVE